MSLHRQLPPQGVEISAGVGERRVELDKLERAAVRIEPLGIACRRCRRRSQTVDGEKRAPPNVEDDVEERFGGGVGGRRGAQVPQGASQEVHLVQQREHRPLSRLLKKSPSRKNRDANDYYRN